ncbi:hypothetical protein [Actinomadura sp. KC345]|uniref:hypothetical protein n=1 Tax=Actinomadura sp. KC345 TaxID=2530371 RepID=UPI001FB6B9C6|nr:hypothetical protein [Actinomadura sp. KC345]
MANRARPEYRSTIASVLSTISLTFIGRPCRASSDTIWIRVGSASALNQAAYSVAVDRSSGPFSSFIVNRR